MSARRATLVLLPLVFATMFVPMVALPRSASAEHVPFNSGFHCSSSCKYAQGKVEYGSSLVGHLSWWGSTASGTCDPTNDVTRWRLDHTAVYNDGNNAKIYGWGPSTYSTNCQIVNDNNPPYAYVLDTQLIRPNNASAHFWWKHDTAQGFSFQEYVRIDF